MKKIILFVLLISATIAYAQSPSNSPEIKKPAKEYGKTSSDALVLSLFSDVWQKVPDSISARGINQGISAAGMYNIKMGTGNFSFAFGLGITVHNFYSNGNLVLDSAKVSEFTKLPTSVNGQKTDYQINKLSIANIDIPVEFRFQTPSKIRIALGFKFGFKLDAHTKYKGADITDGDGSMFVKNNRIENLEKSSYTLTARVGYKWFIVNAGYSLNSIFMKDKGPQMYPISIGLTAIPF